MQEISPLIELLINDDKSFFQVCIHEFIEMAKDEFKISHRVVSKKKETYFKLLRLLSRYVELPALIRKPALYSKASLSITIGPDFGPISENAKDYSRFMYCFDTWPKNNEWLIAFSRIFAIKGIFFSAKQAADNFNNAKGKKTSCVGYWVPEGLKAANYKWKPQEEKPIDVLEFGRKYNAFHNKIREPLAQAGYTHYYSKPGELLFPEEKDFIDGLAKTKVSVCFPSSITHPERSGDISTMTLRYLQSMASKCLIVGKLPYDMEFLFDYNPVIELDESEPQIQLLHVLENIHQYQELIEKNYQEVLKNHQWSNRIKDIMNKQANLK